MNDQPQSVSVPLVGHDGLIEGLIEPIVPTLEERQLLLESEMVCAGVERYNKETDKAKDRGCESDTKYGHRLVLEVLELLVPAIKAYLKTQTGKLGRAHAATRYLRAVKPEVSAYIALTTLVDKLTTDKVPLTGAAIRIANCIEDEVRFMGYDKLEEKPKRNYYRKMRKNLLKSVQNPMLRRQEIKESMVRKLKVADWDKWVVADKVHLGLKLIELVCDCLNFIRVVTKFKDGDKHKTHYVELTPEGLTWIKDFNEHAGHLGPTNLAMVSPPLPWTTPTDGGYHSEAVRLRNPLTKAFNKSYTEELAKRDLTTVYTGLNAIQATPWVVNVQVYKVFRKLWNSGSQIGKLPCRDNEPPPTKPADIATNTAARVAWRKARHHIEIANAALESKRIAVRNVCYLANKFKDEARIYFPHNLDFRGRAYPLPYFLTPQGPDHAKALLKFAEGKPLGDQVAADWLAVHGANTWGFDKVPFADRIKWVKDNEENIYQSATDPYVYDFWTKADSPWQFLAFCVEWKGYIAKGLDFVSSLPIALDGSCNGIQHFSAMLRDEVGGKAVNLVPSEKPQDIYQVVADRLAEKLSLRASQGEQMATQWLALGITRKTTKRCVMVLPYGGTLYAFRTYIQEHIQDRLAEGVRCPFDDKTRLFKPSAYLSVLLWASVEETVKAAVEAMAWLQKVAGIVGDHGLPVCWTTPSGFVVFQHYQESTLHDIKTQIFGRSYRSLLHKDTLQVDRRRQQQSIAPNFVHSLDASAMMHCVADAVPLGINAFSMIHDSFGTTAADTETLNTVIRFAFVHQVYNTNVLQSFADEVRQMLPVGVELPPIPAMGTLDLESVEKSAFFFA